jgi:thioredoxin-like negative regulator of GroEL
MLMDRRIFGLSALSAGLVAGMPAHAAARQVSFDQARFDAARSRNLPVLVFVAADWCPTCRVQGPIISRLAADPAYARLQIFRLDYDAQRPQRRALQASRQATLIAFKNGREVGRSVGATQADQIRSLMRLTIA